MICPAGEFDRLFFIPINLSFFDEGEKTEQPTARKREKAREEGQVAKSPEVTTALLFLAMFFGLKLFAEMMFNGMKSVFNLNFTMIADIDNVFNLKYMSDYIVFMFSQVLLIALPVFAISIGISIFTNVIQVGWKITPKALKPKFSKLNPIKGFKRLFSMRVLVDLVKAIMKFTIIIVAIYFMIESEVRYIPQLAFMGLMPAVLYLGDVIVRLGLNVGLLFLIIALFDVLYTRFRHTKDLRMSKQEIKEEYKSIEGNPQIKGKIKQRMREMSQKRMMQQVPNADVIITNPTHYAVALKYDKEVSDAPFVVAKGVDHIAKKIRETAKDHKVEIVENVQLARTLYSTVEIGGIIPPELYQAVAEILAFVYKLKGGLN